MSYPRVEVSGSFSSGLMIEADLAPHLAGKGDPTRSIILTPHQAEALLKLLLSKKEGFQLVPREPTFEMLSSGCRAGLDVGVLMDDTRFSCEMAVWKAMLANVPGLP